MEEGHKFSNTKKKWILVGVFLCFILLFVVFIFLIHDGIIRSQGGNQIYASDIDQKMKCINGGGILEQGYYTARAEELSNLLRSPLKSNTQVPALNVYRTVHLEDTDSYYDDKLQTIKDRVKSNYDLSLKEENYSFYDQESKSYSVDLMSDNFRIWLYASDSGTMSTEYRIWNPDGPAQPLELFGEKIVISFDESDESIKNKLSEALTFANKIFGTNCEFQSMKRTSKRIGEGTVSVGVEAFETEENMNQAMYNQYFESIDFLFMDDVNDEDEISLLGIYYTEYELENAFSEEVTLLSVKEAEDYLKKGYIYAVHMCPICRKTRGRFDLNDYDGVEIVYRQECLNKYVIPFYAFYKQDGDDTYRYTYVPAVEVQGLKQYFKSQESWHEDSKN